jgi:hypothetical protein
MQGYMVLSSNLLQRSQENRSDRPVEAIYDDSTFRVIDYRSLGVVVCQTVYLWVL